jgi:predicted transcriptional regulator
MSVTSLKLPEALRARIQKLVKGTEKSAHAFMVEAIETAAQREELRRRFGQDAAEAERETERTGKAYNASEIFDYLENRAKGVKAKRPRAKAWRKSA